eukprot:767612-Hanusia_phi.AAC.3
MHDCLHPRAFPAASISLNLPLPSSPHNLPLPLPFFHFPFLNLLPQSSSPSHSLCTPGQRGKGMTSRMFSMPVQKRMRRSKPRPKPECTQVPNFLRSVYHS